MRRNGSDTADVTRPRGVEKLSRREKAANYRTSRILQRPDFGRTSPTNMERHGRQAAAVVKRPS